MESMKNTIVLGCFILAGFGFQTWMQIEHQPRYERVPNQNNHGTEIRFDKVTGEYQGYVDFFVNWQSLHPTGYVPDK